MNIVAQGPLLATLAGSAGNLTIAGLNLGTPTHPAVLKIVLGHRINQGHVVGLGTIGGVSLVEGEELTELGYARSYTYYLFNPPTGAGQDLVLPISGTITGTQQLNGSWEVVEDENLDVGTPPTIRVPSRVAFTEANQVVDAVMDNVAGEMVLPAFWVRDADTPSSLTNFTEGNSNPQAPYGSLIGAMVADGDDETVGATWDSAGAGHGVHCHGMAFTLDAAGPAPTSATPDTGDVAGGTEVSIAGTGFDASGGTAEGVTFGGTPATDVVFVGPTEITCTTPAHAAGAVDVVVTNGDGTTGTIVSGFTYEEPPAGPILDPNPMTATDVSGESEADLTSDIPLDGTPGAYLEPSTTIDGVQIIGDALLPSTP